MTTVETRTELGTPSVTIPDRDDAVQIIVREVREAGVGCSASEANGFVEMMGRAVDYIRDLDQTTRTWRRPSGRRNCYHFKQWELDLYHGILTVVVPPGIFAPPPGSAQAQLGLHLLRDPALVLVHTWARNDADPRVRDCAVTVHMESAY